MKFSSWILFFRPHAFIGTFLQFIVVFQISKIEISKTDIGLGFLSLILCHFFGMGINQIFDKPIDKINKPYLPLASGAISLPLAISSTFFSGFLALIIAFAVSYGLFLLVGLSSIALYIYSAPPFRYKKHWLLALLTISLTRSLGCLGLSYFFSQSLEISMGLAVFMLFCLLFSMIISISKDIPDIEGDKAFEVTSLVSKIGFKSCQKICLILIFLSCSLLVIENIFFHQLTKNYMSLFVLISLLMTTGFSIYRWKINEFTSSYYRLWLQLYAFYGVIIFS